MSIQSLMPSNHLILCRPLLLPSIFPSIRVFSNESALCTRWPKYWSFSFNISPTNEFPGLISFMMDWLDLPAVQGTLKEPSPTVQKHSVLMHTIQSQHRHHLRVWETPSLCTLLTNWVQIQGNSHDDLEPVISLHSMEQFTKLKKALYL